MGAGDILILRCSLSKKKNSSKFMKFLSLSGTFETQFDKFLEACKVRCITSDGENRALDGEGVSFHLFYFCSIFPPQNADE